MNLTCWILTDGRIGTENNARGLAEALGLAYEVKTIRLRQPWKTLSPWLRWGLRYAIEPQLHGPWPDVVITAGRTPAVGSLYIGQQNPATKRIHITSPGISSRHFDLVIAPKHDRLKGRNVHQTIGALHRVTPEKLADAAAHWAPHFAHLPRPFHVVLVGGDAHGYRLTPVVTTRFMEQIKGLGGSILGTASRRTSPETRQILEQNVTWLWDGTGDNPYLGLIALADDIFVTGDSVSMLSEAASSGKPTYILIPDGDSPKLERCHENLMGGSYISRFIGQTSIHPTNQLDDMGPVLTRVRKLLGTPSK